MSKDSYSVIVGIEQGRISQIRLGDEKKLVGTFIGTGCSTGRTVSLDQVQGANKKSAKQIQAEVEAIQQKAQRLKNSGPGDKDAPRVK